MRAYVDGKLVHLECDKSGCRAKIRPNPDIAKSGWTVHGCFDRMSGTKFEWDYCPEHSEAA